MVVLDIPQTWTFVSYVRESVANYLPDSIDQEIRDAAVMVASELTENTIKFGCPPNSLPGTTMGDDERALIDVDYSDNHITIMATTTASLGNLDRLKNIIDALKTTENTEIIYLNRLQEIMETPSQSSSQLGLIRIVHEALFSLSYDIQENRLKLTATRVIK